MALRSLGSLIRGTTRARACFSSPGIAVHQETPLRSAAGSEAQAALYTIWNLAYHVDARPVPAAAAAAASASAQTRGLRSRVFFYGAERPRRRRLLLAGDRRPGVDGEGSTAFPVFHSLRDVAAEHPRSAPAALTVAAFSAFAGILYMMIHTSTSTDESSDEARTEEDMEDDC
ncbi:unnamed protein product [Urochloa humidicola]